MSKQSERANALMDRLRDGFARLRDAGNVALPSDDDILAAITDCLSTRDGAWRKTAPGGDTPSDLLWRLVKFHRSGGSLYGWPWMADRTLTDQYDTVAQVLILLSGQELTAVNAWNRALYG